MFQKMNLSSDFILSMNSVPDLTKNFMSLGLIKLNGSCCFIGVILKLTKFSMIK
jgi:hypothetical protein